MSTAAQPRLAARSVAAATLAPWAIFAGDVVALEAAFALGFGLRRILSAHFPAGIGVDQILGVAAAILLLPVIHYQIGLYPGYVLGPVERLRRRILATLAVFGGLVAWDNIVARGVLSRGVLLGTLLFALVLPHIAEMLIRKILIRRNGWGIPVVLLGAGASGSALARTLLSQPELGLKPVAFLDDRPDSWNRVVEGIPVIGPLDLASDFESRAEAAIISMADIGKEATS